MTQNEREDLRVRQAIAAGADPSEAAAAAQGISRITIPDSAVNRAGVSEDIDNEVYFTEMNGLT